MNLFDVGYSYIKPVEYKISQATEIVNGNLSSYGRGFNSNFLDKFSIGVGFHFGGVKK
ncbi:hypothetical protein [Solitalea lacus]|uniref:hypothetical protein n=1 Tax=Solitalea lacus TaxID=2911172 RepID=UPI001EDA01E9|nr:hypothetical protein [Solitalea lacus]UKJ08827.1 hypothetical protein L2B55_06575 [Solitalea lacus]